MVPVTFRRNSVPLHNRQCAGVVFDQRCQALDPVTVIAIKNAANVANFSLVNVATNDTIQTAAPCFICQRLLKIANEADGRLGFVFQVLRQRPIGKAQFHPHMVEPVIDLEDQVVQRITQVGQPLGMRGSRRQTSRHESPRGGGHQQQCVPLHR